MKPINEIMFRLSAIVIFILLPIVNPSGIGDTLLIVLCGIGLGCFMVDFLIAFKEWWNE